MIDTAFLRLLRCPVAHSRLTLADAVLVDRVNQAIREERVVNRASEKVGRTLVAALITDDAARLHPIREGIVCLLADEAINLDQIKEVPNNGVPGDGVLNDEVAAEMDETNPDQREP